MEAILSTKGQIVLPAEVRKRLGLTEGERLTVEVRGDAVVLRAAKQRRRYRAARHRKSGLPVMVAVKAPRKKVTAVEIARLAAELP